jgi:hypothetical protein
VAVLRGTSVFSESESDVKVTGTVELADAFFWLQEQRITRKIKPNKIPIHLKPVVFIRLKKVLDFFIQGSSLTRE